MELSLICRLQQIYRVTERPVLSGPRCCSLMKVDSCRGKMMAPNDVGDDKESAFHKPLLPLVAVELYCGSVCLVNTEWSYNFGMVQ